MKPTYDDPTPAQAERETGVGDYCDKCGLPLRECRLSRALFALVMAGLCVLAAWASGKL